MTWLLHSKRETKNTLLRMLISLFGLRPRFYRGRITCPQIRPLQIIIHITTQFAISCMSTACCTFLELYLCTCLLYLVYNPMPVANCLKRRINCTAPVSRKVLFKLQIKHSVFRKRRLHLKLLGPFDQFRVQVPNNFISRPDANVYVL